MIKIKKGKKYPYCVKNLTEFDIKFCDNWEQK